MVLYHPGLGLPRLHGVRFWIHYIGTGQWFTTVMEFSAIGCQASLLSLGVNHLKRRHVLRGRLHS